MADTKKDKAELNPNYVTSSRVSAADLEILEHKLKKMSAEATAFIRAKFYGAD